MQKTLILYSDGGARGNPGPAAIAFVALNEQGETLKSESKFIGVRTNNQAEYEALTLALKFAKNYSAEAVVCHLDSELVAKQVKGEYSVKNNQLKELWCKVQELKRCFKKISFINVPRTNLQIQQADSLVNEVLDEASRNGLSKTSIKQ